MTRAAFDALFDEHFITVVRYIERRVWDPSVAEDLAADAFRTGWEKLQHGASVDLPWLLVTAGNKVRDFNKRLGRRRRAEIALRRLDEEPVAEISGLDRLAVREAVSKLSTREREVVLLTYWEGLSADEISAVVGISSGAVWTSLSRSRAKLRSILGDQVMEERGDSEHVAD
ncbi:hypothetical protein ASD65_10210 [Microbacterium sp. Root61]|uniref:RNA polymerase sigma factor n=1 Tax=Microbacterium sp. Root61 TaxID=1736570 RepID=UPI0006F1F165|nr:RNA polymerase sigma factor [Microbacterium sp. Root61]KRA24752.1 hypothetical protein ASD65_10210 [Microbacterium sp. Root61]